jgi:hypothetical protein
MRRVMSLLDLSMVCICIVLCFAFCFCIRFVFCFAFCTAIYVALYTLFAFASCSAFRIESHPIVILLCFIVHHSTTPLFLFHLSPEFHNSTPPPLLSQPPDFNITWNFEEYRSQQHDVPSLKSMLEFINDWSKELEKLRNKPIGILEVDSKKLKGELNPLRDARLTEIKEYIKVRAYSIPCF